ncbi:sulfotransferase [Gloeothece verrucosa]|uniref:Sulfotransferase n=1 Tax=Gloeothece verrucosa (strain PCC 7822) TaxID=497965 RepID=E0U7F1_GLOV7|nr:sulfotransferase [Gloeothece verrucosa]ADN13647.1 hypothetical protein Cyan7822_1657 [Gloeothece verrucosa PCC 7822]
MENFKLLIHIGYPKTASTWLQKTIFNDPKVGFISPWGSPSGLAVNQFITTNSFRFCPESTYKIFEPGLQAATEQQLTAVLSQEMLSGDQIAGKYWGKEVADRLNAVFPSALVLIIIREQKSMVLSSYGQYIRNGGEQSIEEFIGADNPPPGFTPICRLDYLEYDLLISYYHKLFGRDRVFVLPFEELKNNPANFIKKILNFVDIKDQIIEFQKANNVNYKGFTLAIMRNLNNFLPPPDFSGKPHPLIWRLNWKVLDTIDQLLPSSIQHKEELRLKQFIADYIDDKFAESNQRTNELIGIDLGKFGYRL